MVFRYSTPDQPHRDQSGAWRDLSQVSVRNLHLAISPLSFLRPMSACKAMFTEAKEAFNRLGSFNRLALYPTRVVSETETPSINNYAFLKIGDPTPRCVPCFFLLETCLSLSLSLLNCFFGGGGRCAVMRNLQNVFPVAQAAQGAPGPFEARQVCRSSLHVTAAPPSVSDRGQWTGT